MYSLRIGCVSAAYRLRIGCVSAAYRPCIELYRQRPTAIRVSMMYCACIGRIVLVSDMYRHSSCESSRNTCINVVSRRICGVSEARVLTLCNTTIIHGNTR